VGAAAREPGPAPVSAGGPGPAALLLLGPLAALVAALLLAPLRAWLNERELLDRPNERSSHARPTPRGAGLLLLPLLLLAWLALDHRFDLPGAAAWVLLAALALTGLSWLDDLGGLGALPRLAAHAGAVALGLAALPAGFSLTQGLLPPWLDYALAGLAWLWFLELVNFMDGIDAISGASLGVMAFGLVLLAALGLLAPGVGLAALVLLGLLLGFLAWNWPPAALFLGDCGAVPLGYLLGWLLLLAADAGLWPAALILPLAYWADATLTLLQRLLRGERFWQAHRQHFYQRAAVQAGHGAVALAFALAGLALLALALWAVLAPRPWSALGAALLLVLCLLAWLQHRARR